MSKPALKPVEEWTLADLTALPVGEWDWLDVKDARFLEEPDWQGKMGQFISAWSNYEGGYLIIGVADPKAAQEFAFHGSDLSAMPAFMERLDAIIPNLVDPPIIHFTTRAIPLESGRSVIVIHIRESENAPHQAVRDRKYFARRGRHLDALRHREIIDIFGRTRHPKIETTLIFNMYGDKPNLHWRPRNVSNVLARHIKAVIEFPTSVFGSGINFPEEVILLEKPLSRFELRLTNGLSPLFPQGDLFKNLPARVGVRFHPPIGPSIDEITVTTYADSMPPSIERFSIEQVCRRTP